MIITQPSAAIMWQDKNGAEVLTTAGHRLPVTSARYHAALAALDAAERRAPCLLLPEYGPYNAAVLRPARAEVRAAWIEAAGSFGINPDMW